MEEDEHLDNVFTIPVDPLHCVDLPHTEVSLSTDDLPDLDDPLG